VASTSLFYRDVAVSDGAIECYLS